MSPRACGCGCTGEVGRWPGAGKFPKLSNQSKFEIDDALLAFLHLNREHLYMYLTKQSADALTERCNRVGTRGNVLRRIATRGNEYTVVLHRSYPIDCFHEHPIIVPSLQQAREYHK